MSNARIELGGGTWAVKNDGVGGRNLLGYAVGDTSGKYLPRDFYFVREGDIASTRVNKDGLIEKYRENLIKSSNDFTATGWISANSTVFSGYSGYDGTNDAWFLRSDSGSFCRVAMGNTTSTGLDSTGLRTFSVYAKKKDYDYVGLYIQGSNKGVVFSLLDGTAVNSLISYPEIYSDGVDVGGGWWRFSISHLTTTSTTAAAVYACETTEYNGNSNHGNGIYIQDAQFEYGLVATDYIESGSSTGKAGVLDNLPRIDYTSGSAQLLMEPSRTNKIEYSEYFNAWTKQAAVTITDNATTSPSGSNDASKYSISLPISRALDQTTTLTSGVTYTFSMWVKAIVDTQIRVRSDGNEWSEIFTVLVSDGWKRIESAHTMASDSYEFGFFDVSGGSGDRFYIWGAQLEAGSYVTSYIPTYGAQDTRPSDICNNFDDIQIGNSYTVLFDFDLTNNPVDNTIAFQMNNSSGTTSFTARWHGSTDEFRIYNNIDAQYPVSTTYSSSTKKWVLRIDGTSFDLFHNDSGTPTKRTGTAMTTARDLDEFQFKQTRTYVNNIKIFDSALSDLECKALVE